MTTDEEFLNEEQEKLIKSLENKIDSDAERIKNINRSFADLKSRYGRLSQEIEDLKSDDTVAKSIHEEELQKGYQQGLSDETRQSGNESEEDI